MTSRGNGWMTVPFGDVVKLNKERVQDPLSEGLDRYVGLEHLEPGDLTIRRWGNVADGTTFTNVFRPGQVLFVKRRAYQRKVAVADFSGVCSGDIYVLTPKDDRLSPDLLPFICQTDSFFDHAIATSAGSLSPRTNWKSLASYEFALPPLDEQRRLQEALGSSASLQEEFSRLGRAHTSLTSSFIRNTFASLTSTYPLEPIDQFGEATMGRQKAPRFQQGKSPRPYVRVANIGWLTMSLDDLEEMDFSPSELERYRLIPGDILLTEGDLISEFNVGRPAIFEGGVEDCCFQNTLIRLRPNRGVSPLFLLLVLEGARLNHVFAKAAKTTTVTHLGLGRFRSLRLPFPPPEVQAGLAGQMSLLLNGRRVVEQRSRTVAEFHQRLLAGALS